MASELYMRGIGSNYLYICRLERVGGNKFQGGISCLVGKVMGECNFSSNPNIFCSNNTHPVYMLLLHVNSTWALQQYTKFIHSS